MNFAASYDRTTKILTAVVCLALLGAAVAIQNLIATVVSLLVIVLGYAYSPRGYTLEDGGITIRRWIGSVRIPLEGVREVRAGDSSDFRGCVRLWGSGGLFGYYGLFRTSKLGHSTWYMTDRSRAIVLVTTSKTVLVSPDDVQGFLKVVRQQTHLGDSAALPATQPEKSSFRLAYMIPILGGLASVALVVALMRYDPGPPVSSVSGAALSIQDPFFPVTIGAASTDVAGIRVVDLERETDWRPVQRVGGFANPHYQSGWFKTAGGTRIRLYRTSGTRRLVLLPPKARDAPVLLQADDPDALAQRLRQEWRGY